MNKRAKSAANARPVAAEISETIVYHQTSDGLELRGVLIRPDRARQHVPALCIWVHTRQQNFSEPEYVGIGRLLAAEGFAFLSVDTRGHDFGSWFRTADGPVLFGSAWERFSDCVLDLDAWIDFAVGLGYRRVVLVGHGFGGAKVLHFQAQRQRTEVAVVALASSGASVRDKFSDEEQQLAQEMVAARRGRDLMPWGTGGDTYTSTVSAEWYLARTRMHAELYGTDVLPPAIARIRVPVVAWYGEKESRKNRDVREMLEWLRSNAVEAPQFVGQIVNDLGFFYRGRETVVAGHLVSSLRAVGIGLEHPAK